MYQILVAPGERGKSFSIDGGRLNLTINDYLVLVVPKEYRLPLNVSVEGIIEVLRFKPVENVTKEKICNPNEKGVAMANLSNALRLVLNGNF